MEISNKFRVMKKKHSTIACSVSENASFAGVGVLNFVSTAALSASKRKTSFDATSSRR